MERIEVRLTLPEDFPCYLAMKSERAGVRWSGLGAPPDPADFGQWFADQFANPDRIMFTALVDAEQAGYVHFRRISGDTVETSQGVSAKFLCGVVRRRRREPRVSYCPAFRRNAILELMRLAPEIVLGPLVGLAEQ